ncbi:hypothetical protein P8452_70817 [Trifolium repens]|nr:hypothetical protein P8452_70817 [Trifolium repens]
MPYVCGTPKEKRKTPKQTPLNQDSSSNPKSERHPSNFRLLEQSQTQPRKLSQLDSNSLTRSKAFGRSESRISSIKRTADQTKVEREPRQTSLGNDRGTTMRPVVAK